MGGLTAEHLTWIAELRADPATAETASLDRSGDMHTAATHSLVARGQWTPQNRNRSALLGMEGRPPVGRTPETAVLMYLYRTDTAKVVTYCPRCRRDKPPVGEERLRLILDADPAEVDVSYLSLMPRSR